jgi:hypothetical protein
MTENIKLQEFVAGIMESKLENYCSSARGTAKSEPTDISDG